MSEKQMFVSKVVLSTERVVLLRELKIRHTEQAAQIVAPKAGGDATVLSLMMQKELLKLLIIQVDGETPSAMKLEDLDDLFSYAEYSELLQVVGQLMGNNKMGKPKTELVAYGGK